MGPILGVMDVMVKKNIYVLLFYITGSEKRQWW